jgi:hypothetical protein
MYRSRWLPPRPAGRIAEARRPAQLCVVTELPMRGDSCDAQRGP